MDTPIRITDMQAINTNLFKGCVICRCDNLSLTAQADRYIICDFENPNRIIWDNNRKGWRSVQKALNALKTIYPALHQPDGTVLTFSEYRAEKAKKLQLQKSETTKLYVHNALQRLLEFNVPTYQEIEPLAEYICRTLFKGYAIFKWTTDNLDMYDNSGDVCQMNLDDLIALVAETKKECKNEDDGEFYFLQNLYTGEREATYCSGHGWSFTTFKDVFDKRIKEITEQLYPIIAAPLHHTDEEECYFNENFELFDEQECEKKFELEYQFQELFYQYLRKQDWKRFIPEVKRAIRDDAFCF